MSKDENLILKELLEQAKQTNKQFLEIEKKFSKFGNAIAFMLALCISMLLFNGYNAFATKKELETKGIIIDISNDTNSKQTNENNSKQSNENALISKKNSKVSK